MTDRSRYRLGLRWNSELETGDALVDLQHQRLFALVNEFHELCDEGNGASAVRSAIAELVLYTKAHFLSEEDLMAAHDFPMRQEHAMEHEQISRTVSELVRDYQNVDVLDMSAFLYDWLVQHILKWDLPMIRAVGNKT